MEIERHLSGLDAATGQVLGYSTRTGGERLRHVPPEDTQVVRSSVQALWAHQLPAKSSLSHVIASISEQMKQPMGGRIRVR